MVGEVLAEEVVEGLLQVEHCEITVLQADVRVALGVVVDHPLQLK